MGQVPFNAFKLSANKNRYSSVNMNEVVGKNDILMVCLDTLRYDAAIAEEKEGGTPILNRYGKWEKRYTHGSFTYPAHHAIFSGFLPMPEKARNLAQADMLFFPKSISGMGGTVPEGSYGFTTSTIPQGLHEDGYDTWCIGGVGFFDKRSEMGKVFPSMFEKSYWKPAFSCSVKESVDNQVDFILKKLDKADKDTKIFMYLNVCAIHYPNCFYIDGCKNDSIETHRAALRYVDKQLGRLFDTWKEKRGKTFVICLSDHGSCYGEDGFVFHGVNHDIVNTVPYKHFFI